MPDIYNMSDVFISYSRRNTEFVRRLFEDLKAHDKEVWADFEDIPKAADWWREIQAGIDASDAFVFVITPDSVQSEICRKEIEHAVGMNKRLLPVLREEITDPEDKAAMHPSISSHNWIFFREEDDYDAALQLLIESIETDLDHNRTLSRVLVRAKEWQTNNKNSAYLLQGEDLEQAGDWLAQAYQKQPRPTELHVEYIEASREAEQQRQRRLLTLVSAGLVVAILLAVFAAYQTVLANRARQDAVAARQIAEDNASKAQSLALAASSSQALGDNNPDLALALANEAVNIDASQSQVYTALADSAYGPGTRLVVNSGFKLIFSLAYAPNSEVVAVGFETGEICLRDTTTGDQVRCLTLANSAIPHESSVERLIYSRDGSLLMSMSTDTINLWNIRQGGAVMDSFYVDDADEDMFFSSATLSGDGSQLLIGYSTGEVERYDWTADEVFRFGDIHDGQAVTAVAISPDGTEALSGGDDGIIKHLALDDDPLVLATLRRHRRTIYALKFIPRTNLAISGSEDTFMYTWNLQSSLPVNTFEGHDSAVTEVLVNPTSQTVFSSSWDNSIREWDWETGRQVRGYYGHSGGINSIALSLDARQLISGGYDTDLRFWNVDSFVRQQRITPPSPEAPRATAYGERAFIAGFSDGTAIVFDRISREPVSFASPPGGVVAADDRNNDTGDASVNSVVDLLLLPDGERYLTLYSDGTVILRAVDDTRAVPVWDVTMTDTLNGLLDEDDTMLTAEANPMDLALHPDGDEWLAVDMDNGLLRYDVESGEFIDQIPYVTPADFLVARYHPDGESVIVGLNDRIFNLHQVSIESGEILQTFDGHSDGILSIDFNTETTWMATGSFDNTMIIWELATGDIVRTFAGHSDRVGSVAFNPFDSNQVASASNDRTMKLWNIATGFEIFTFEGHTERVIDVHFSVDGDTILTASTDGSLILWRQPQSLDDLIAWMNDNRYVRELTCFEREQYLGIENACDVVPETGESSPAPAAG